VIAPPPFTRPRFSSSLTFVGAFFQIRILETCKAHMPPLALRALPPANYLVPCPQRYQTPFGFFLESVRTVGTHFFSSFALEFILGPPFPGGTPGYSFSSNRFFSFPVRALVLVSPLTPTFPFSAACRSMLSHGRGHPPPPFPPPYSIPIKALTFPYSPSNVVFLPPTPGSVTATRTCQNFPLRFPQEIAS